MAASNVLLTAERYGLNVAAWKTRQSGMKNKSKKHFAHREVFLIGCGGYFLFLHTLDFTTTKITRRNLEIKRVKSLRYD